MKSLTGWQSAKTELSIDPDGAPTPIYTYVIPQETEAFSQEIQLNGKLFDNKLNFVAGGFYYDEKIPAQIHSSLSLLFGQPIPSTVEERNLKSYAGFIDGTFALSEKLKLIAGFRYAEDHKSVDAFLQGSDAVLDTASGTFDSSTYRGGVQYQWNPDVMTYLTVSTGYRAGGFNPFNAAPQLSLFRFDPEKSTSYEAGARLQFADRRVTVNPTAFYVDWSDIQVQNVQVTDSTTGQTGIVLQNVAKARSYGFELESQVQATDSIRLFGNLAYLNIRYTEIGAATGLTVDSDLQRAPKLTFALGASHTLTFAGGSSLESTLNYSYEDEQQSSPKTSLLLPEYGLLNGRIAYTNQTERWTLALFATNILDEHYYVGGVDYTGIVGSPHYDVGRPLEIGASIRFNF